MTTAKEQALELIESFLHDNEIVWEPGVGEDELVVSLPGDKKLTTVCSLRVGDTDLSVTAFVIRHPDENAERFYAHLLRANLRNRGLAYAIDGSGDVYLTGRLPLAALDAAALDRLLGAVLAGADGPFNDLLVIGFLSSMRKEWAWRISRGESTRNLQAFAHLLQDDQHPDARTTDE